MTIAFSSRRDEYPRSSPPGVMLGITREHILQGKVKDLFLPGDIILFRYRQYPPGILELYKQQQFAKQSKWKGCELCWPDYVCGLSVIAISTVTTVSAVLGPISSFTFAKVTSKIANMTLRNLVEGYSIPIILASTTLPFLAMPYLTNSSTHPHPHFFYRLCCRIFESPDTKANFTQMLHIRSSFWKYLTKSNTSTHPPSRQRQPQPLLPSDNRRPSHRRLSRNRRPNQNPTSNSPTPTQPTTNPISLPSLLFPLQAGELITILTPYPDLFTCSYLRPLNALYLRFREWRRWHTAAFIYAELEHLGALQLDAEARGYLPPVEYQVVRLLEDLNSGGENGAGYAVNRRKVADHVEMVERCASDFGVDVVKVPGVLPFRG